MVRNRSLAFLVRAEDYVVAHRADVLDIAFDLIPGLKIYRWFACKADPFGRARRDEIARQQGHALGQVVDDVGHGEHHIGRGAVLH